MAISLRMLIKYFTVSYTQLTWKPLFC